MKPSFDDLDVAAGNAGEALGLLESAGIAEGYAAADRVLKAAQVELLLCRPVSPGKQLVIFAGSPAAVVASLRAGIEGLPGPPLDTLLLPQVEPRLVRALAGESAAPRGEAAGILECATVATLLVAADAALKVAAIELLVLRAAVGLGGKSFFCCSGEVAQVEAALAVARDFAQRRGQLAGSVVLPQPDRALARWLRGAHGP